MLTAKATDNLNATTTSSAVNITVSGPGPTTPIYFIHTDHLNTPRLIANQAQQVVWRWDNNDPFGGNAPEENPSGLGNFTCNLRLPGQYFDRETNLHYNYFRDYEPGIGRYIQSDPIGLQGGVNTYAYVGGNPISISDAFGLFGCGPGKRAIPAPGNEKEFPKIALCVEDPGSNPNAKICMTPECGGGILPNPPVDPCERECFYNLTNKGLCFVAGQAAKAVTSVPSSAVSIPCSAITFRSCVDECRNKKTSQSLMCR